MLAHTTPTGVSTGTGDGHAWLPRPGPLPTRPPASEPQQNPAPSVDTPHVCR